MPLVRVILALSGGASALIISQLPSFSVLEKSDRRALGFALTAMLISLVLSFVSFILLLFQEQYKEWQESVDKVEAWTAFIALVCFIGGIAYGGYSAVIVLLR